MDADVTFGEYDDTGHSHSVAKTVHELIYDNNVTISGCF
ncbi:hypothetical protein ABID16_003041 [Rhizobium aquaticum]|uniref:Uncharacterized protein n=1 Tax=Rhizobium aquaticum TaxID=1549636 RepID=A0ABV2J4B6_9HYPH